MKRGWKTLLEHRTKLQAYKEQLFLQNKSTDLVTKTINLISAEIRERRWM